MTTITLITVATAEATPVWASDFIADPLVQVSGTSPFGSLSNCGDFPGTPPGTVWLDSEVEPWVDVNPTNPANIVGSWQQDRWSNGGARGLVAAASFDGGATWTIVPIPGITDCTGGEFQRASDPWLSFAPNGALYQMSLVFNTDPPLGIGGFGENAMLVSRSQDGGLSWSDPVTLIRDEDTRFLNDKNSITADPTDSNFVYAVWDRLQLPPDVVVNPEQHYGFGFKGPAMLARTTDGGTTWEPARIIYEPGVNNQTVGNQIVVQSNGILVDFFNEIRNFRDSDGTTTSEFNVSLIRSTDKGVTWSRPIHAHRMLTIGVFDPETGDPIRTGDIIPEPAVDPHNGALYVVWQDARFSGFDEIAFSLSTEGGDTWSAPIKINQTPGGIGNNGQAFTPAIRVGGDGTITVTYYDFRNNDEEVDLKTDYFAVHCHAATTSCTDPANWSETQLTATSFDMRQAPLARGFFTGDYEGLGTDGIDFFTFFSQPHVDDSASVFFGRVGL